MHARMLKMQVKPERIDEAARLFAEDIVPNCREQAGYRGAYFLVDRKLGECVPIMLWETEADMIATEENRFFQTQLVKFLGLFHHGLIREAYEIVVVDHR
ncbi:MAG: antibiotic biosynthesis monooxygenase [Acidobacteria bacterium]|nr:antibiotic biosynthesis monooxygenase [Acidobacteriota bacterium]MBE3130523.1 antibiotic biosynthesis monooxygenase [Acidobacteriota bacterium]